MTIRAMRPDLRPRWGEEAPFVQPAEPAFWLYVVLLLAGCLSFAGSQAEAARLDGAFVLSWLLAFAYALPVAFVVYRLDLFEREPNSLLAAALLWGSIVVPPLAGAANAAWLSAFGKIAPDLAAQWGPAIVAPGVEETLKLAGVVTLFLIARREFDGVLDGFVYGAIVGLGFAVVEDVDYFTRAALAAGPGGAGIGPVLDSFVARVVGGGLYGHVLYTGLAGVGFAYLVSRPRVSVARRLAVCVLTVATAAAAHALWNAPVLQFALDTDSGSPSSMQWVVYGALKGGPFLLLLLILLAFATRSEERAFRQIVGGDADGVVTDEEIASLRNLVARRAARKAARRTGGPAAERLTGELQAAQVEYAMLRTRNGEALGSAPHTDALARQRERILALRTGLERLRGDQNAGDRPELRES